MSDRRIALLVSAAFVGVSMAAIVIAIAWDRLAPGVPAPINTPTSAATLAGGCHSVNGLPDSTCTPGVTDPRVTQYNVRTTICLSGYTTNVRPSSAYTDSLKAQQIKAYGYSDTNPADYEEDHLIPLELGGHPTDPKNLWPEPRRGAYSADKKDGVENSLHTKVCSGLMTLAVAQAAIALNWETA